MFRELPFPFANSYEFGRFSNTLRKWFLLLVVLLVGCNQKPAKPTKPTVSEAERPPLRVLLVGSENLKKGIELRWQATSQQPIEITMVEMTELLEKSELKTDVLLFPSQLLGDLVERKWLLHLPTKFATSRIKEQDGSELIWPPGWQKQVLYGKKSWGVPLGFSVPMLIRSGAESDSKGPWPFEELQAITSPERTETELKEEVPSDDDAIVDRYLTLLASEYSISTNLGAFFQLRDMKPRLTESAFEKAARKFVQSARGNPQAWTGSHAQAWGLVEEGKSPWAIGHPKHLAVSNRSASAKASAGADEAKGSATLSVGKLRSEVESENGTNSSGVFIDSGKGFVASVAFTTRQSAVSNYFLEWIDLDEQRESLSRETDGILPRSGQIGFSGSADLPYRRALSEAAHHPKLLTELRLRGGVRYRQTLAKSLRAMVAQPDDLSVLLGKCAQEWEAITEDLGREKQQQSLERSLQLTEAESL